MTTVELEWCSESLGATRRLRSGGQPGIWCAGWIATVLIDGEAVSRRFYAVAGGVWELNRDGIIGRQVQGTCDMRAPVRPLEMATWIAKRVADDLVCGKCDRYEDDSEICVSIIDDNRTVQ